MTPPEPPRRPSPLTRKMAEDLAQAFHENYERLAPNHGYETREESRTDWSQVPADNKALMVATAEAVLDHGWVVNLDTEECHAVVELLTNLGVCIDGAPGRLPLDKPFLPHLVRAFEKLAFANGRHYGLTNFDMGIED